MVKPLGRQGGPLEIPKSVRCLPLAAISHLLCYASSQRFLIFLSALSRASRNDSLIVWQGVFGLEALEAGVGLPIGNSMKVLTLALVT